MLRLLRAGKGSRLSWLRRAQATLEYAVLVGVVAAAFLAMRVYVQRAVQANLKGIEDQINAEPQ